MSRKVLVVDDNPLHRLLISEAVLTADPSLTVVEVDDSRKAITRLEEGGFDIVIVDYFMPGMDGLDLLKEVKARHPNLGVLVVTGSGSEDVAAKAIKFGASDYIVKGENMAERIAAMVIELLESKEDDKTAAVAANARTAIRLVERIEKELRMRTAVGFIKERIIVEFDKPEDFNSFSRWAARKRNLAMETVSILADRYVVLLAINPTAVTKIA